MCASSCLSVHPASPPLLTPPCTPLLPSPLPPATAFRAKYDDKQNALTERIVEARQRLKGLDIAYDFRVKISQICSDLNVDGIRGDIVTNRAAKALAAFEGRTEVAVEDIYR
jgi:magnesium chelatase subunit I